MARAYVPAPRNAAQTSRRLTLALLWYFALVTLVITLSPFDFSPRHLRLSWKLDTSDMAANVALFLPLGFLFRGLGAGSTRQRTIDIAVAVASSTAIEVAQIFIRGRYVSPVDVATNTFGAYLGVIARDRLERWALWHPHTVGRVGLDIPLVGLLYLLVPQLWLSGVGMVEDARRSATTLLLGCAGSIILVALHRHRWQRGVRLAANVVPPLAFLWFTVGALPALAAAPLTFGGTALGVVGMTWWLLQSNTAADQRRFEVDTLARFLPLFIVYLAVSALWPPMRPLTSWHGAIGFADRLNNAGVVDLLLLLEQVGAFTLVGYAVAEWRGRRELSLADDLPLVACAATALAGLLELAQGFLDGPGASLVRAALSVTGAGYGAAVYHLARAHVRVLRASTAEPSLAEHEAA